MIPSATAEESVPQLFTNEAYRAAIQIMVQKARTCFLTYFHLFNPQGHSSIVLGDLHRYLISLVQRAYDGTAPPNNSVSVPPQHGKSTILSIEGPSWLLGVWPTIAIAITGFSAQLCVKFSKAIRTRLKTPLYQLIFPNTLPARGSDRMDEWETTKGGSLIAKGSGSKLTGRRVDWLVMDDVHAGRAEAESATDRKKVIEWYFADCFTRVHPKGRQFLIGTRWHPNDLIGHLTSEERVSQLKAEGQENRCFRHTNIAAICEDPENDPLGRELGEACFPQERPLSYLLSVKAETFTYEWDSNFQGNPRSAASGQVDLTNLRYYTPETVPWDDIDEIARGWDLALSEKQSADYTVGALLGFNNETKAIYILDIYRERMAWPKLKPKIIAIAKKDLNGWGARNDEGLLVSPNEVKKAFRMGMEGVSGFKIGVEEIRTDLLGEVKVELKNPPSKKQGGGSKLLRAQPWLNKIEAGLVYVVRTKWTKDFISELDNFPDGSHDDQIDAVSIAHEMFVKRKQMLIA